MPNFFTYVLVSRSTQETYVGQTEDVARRLLEHNDPLNRRTFHTKRPPGPWLLAYSEMHDSRAAAMKRERFLKTGKGREWIKENLGGWVAGESSAATLTMGEFTVSLPHPPLANPE
jgi:putative endonuclease